MIGTHVLTRPEGNRLYAKARAAELWSRYELSAPVDLKFLVGQLGLEVVEFPFRGRVREVVVDGVIGVQPALPRPWFRWYVAHAMGHHALHVGTSFYLASWQWVSQAKAERQAEEFAAWLLAGPEGRPLTARQMGIPGEKLPLVRERWGTGSTRRSEPTGMTAAGCRCHSLSALDPRRQPYVAEPADLYGADILNELVKAKGFADVGLLLPGRRCRKNRILTWVSALSGQRVSHRSRRLLRT